MRSSRDRLCHSRGRKAAAASTAALLVIILILLGVTGYLGTMLASSSSMPSSASGCPSAAMASSSSSMANTAEIEQNATTAHYKLMLVVAAPEQMLQMCQFTTQTSGMVMVQGAMSNMTTNMSSSMGEYHLVVHVYDITTGATVIPPLSSVSITATNSSGMGMSVPVVEMFDAGQGPASMHYGNNVDLAPGKYTVMVTVMGEEATFNVTLS